DVELEPVRDALAQHARREGPEALAELDLQVHDRLHARRAGVAQDAAVAERARPEFHPPLEPADDLLLGEEACAALDELILRELLVDAAHRGEEALDLGVGEGGPEV